MELEFKVIPYGDQAVLVQFESKISLEIHKAVKHLYTELRRLAQQGVSGVTPGYNSLVVYYEPKVVSFESLKDLIQQCSVSLGKDEEDTYQVIIPVCYDDVFALDIENVSEHTKLKKKEIIQLHTESTYLIYMVGFVPGFMYLGGMNEKLITPRLKSPRLKIPQGSVGIADQQTGIYPLATPGGWQIIGSCPLNLVSFNSAERVMMGDYVKFEQIDLKTYNERKGEAPQRVKII